MVFQGKKNNALEYFSNLNYKMPEFYNPFDFFIEVMVEADEKQSDNLYADYITKCLPDFLKDHEDCKSLLNTKNKNESFLTLLAKKEQRKKINWCLEFWVLLQRSFRNYYRNKTVFYAKLFQYIINTIILFSFYHNIGSPKKIDTLYSNFTGFFYNNCNNFFINGIMYTLYTIPALKSLLQRECAAKLYRMSTFYTSLFITLIIPAVLYSVIFSFLLFEGIQLNKDFTRFLVFFTMNIFIYVTGSTYGLAFGALIPEKVIITVAPFLATMFSLGSGFYKSNNDFPSIFSWVNLISPYRYILEIQMGNQEDFNNITDNILELNGYTSGVTFCLIYLFSTFAFVFIVGYILFVVYSKRF